MSRTNHNSKRGFLVAVALFGIAGLFFFLYRFGTAAVWTSVQHVSIATTTPKAPEPKKVVAHIPTPGAVKAIYMSGCVAGTPSFRAKLVKIADETEINSIVIDIKDSYGMLSFEPKDPLLKGAMSSTCYASDMEDFIAELHEKGIYVIGRITVFQDKYLTGERPDLAVKRKSNHDLVWKDHKGLSFIDVGAREAWERIVLIAKESYAIGFDELNFDYIRFPSDGNMNDAYFSHSLEKTKPEALVEFFKYLHATLKATSTEYAKAPVLSADLFGMTTSNEDDLGIGQVLENALPYFDYIAPMVYPSHYPSGFNGIKNPAAEPYAIISYAMGRGVERARKASSSPLKLRAWIQDFDIGATYTPELIRAQKKALYDLGLTSWMIWDPSNLYTRGALDEQE